MYKNLVDVLGHAKAYVLLFAAIAFSDWLLLANLEIKTQEDIYTLLIIPHLYLTSSYIIAYIVIVVSHSWQKYFAISASQMFEKRSNEAFAELESLMKKHQMNEPLNS